MELILYKLNRHELLNDSEFADQWARSRMTRNIGHRRIAMELKQKGVDSETIEQALERIDENDEIIKNCSMRKAPSLCFASDKGYIRFLQSRPDHSSAISTL